MNTAERLIQFQCGREGTLFYYQTSVKRPHFVNHCPVCGSKRVTPTGRDYRAVEENSPLPSAKREG
jgi:hypothetical protein